jgi:hypothetical protein
MVKATRRTLSGMRILVFVSGPSDLSPEQDEIRNAMLDILKDEMLEPRALGRTDYPLSLPLAEVCVIAGHCAGGLILGFEQFRATEGVRRYGARNANGDEVSQVIRKDVRVILTTHSPSTVALAPEEPIFVMSREHPPFRMSL